MGDTDERRRRMRRLISATRAVAGARSKVRRDSKAQATIRAARARTKAVEEARRKSSMTGTIARTRTMARGGSS